MNLEQATEILEKIRDRPFYEAAKDLVHNLYFLGWPKPVDMRLESVGETPSMETLYIGFEGFEVELDTELESVIWMDGAHDTCFVQRDFPRNYGPLLRKIEELID